MSHLVLLPISPLTVEPLNTLANLHCQAQGSLDKRGHAQAAGEALGLIDGQRLRGDTRYRGSEGSGWVATIKFGTQNA